MDNQTKKPSVIFISKALAETLTTPTLMISIGEPGESLNLQVEPEDKLRLEFDDVEYDVGPEYRLFDYIDALKILRFIKKHEGQSILVHCHAGISRSAAVAKFMIDKLGYSQPKKLNLQDMSGHNTLVYRQLELTHLDEQARISKERHIP